MRLYPHRTPEQIAALDTLLDRFATILVREFTRVSASDEAWSEFLALTEKTVRPIVEEEPSHQRSKNNRREKNV